MVGEYEAGYFGNRLTILDIGSNLGCFTLWANMRWPSSMIHAYERNPGHFECLRKLCGVFRTCSAIMSLSVQRINLQFRSFRVGQGSGLRPSITDALRSRDPRLSDKLGKVFVSIRPRRLRPPGHLPAEFACPQSLSGSSGRSPSARTCREHAHSRGSCSHDAGALPECVR